MGIEKTVQFSRAAGGERVILDSGTYEASLAEVKNDIRKKYQSEESEPCIKFRFEVYTDDGTAFIWKDVTPSVHERSNLQKTFKAMTGQQIDSQLPDTEIIKLLESLVGHHYMVTMEQKKSSSGALRNQFVSVSALPKKPVTRSKPGITTPPADPVDDDDNIIF